MPTTTSAQPGAPKPGTAAADLVCELTAIAHRLRTLSATTGATTSTTAAANLAAAAISVDAALDRLHACVPGR